MTIELNNYSQRSPKTLHAWGIAVLLLVTVIWGASFAVLKEAVNSLSPAAILATRLTSGEIQVNKPIVAALLDADTEVLNMGASQFCTKTISSVSILLTCTTSEQDARTTNLRQWDAPYCLSVNPSPFFGVYKFCQFGRSKVYLRHL